MARVYRGRLRARKSSDATTPTNTRFTITIGPQGFTHPATLKVD
jgi:hypothetical protein